MKNVYGLLLALGLGVAGGMFNWAYLRSEAQNMVMTSFIGLATDVERGHRLEESNLVPIPIPKESVGNLDEFGIRWSARNSVIGDSMSRFRKAGSLLVQEDTKTPPPSLNLGPGEAVISLPVDTRTFVPSLVNPGDQISFIVPPAPGAAKSIVAEDPAAKEPQPSSSPEPFTTIGPFTVLAMGNRLSSPDVMKAAKIAQLQENVIGVRAHVDKDHKIQDALVIKLLSVLSSTNYRPLAVQLEPLRANRK
jgi:hypothetical protein